MHIKRDKETYICEIRNTDILSWSDGDTMVVGIANCVARKSNPRSFLGQVAEKFPYGNPYTKREKGCFDNLTAEKNRPVLGTCIVKVPPQRLDRLNRDVNQDVNRDVNRQSSWPHFAILYAQYRMGNTNSSYFEKSSRIDEDYLYKSHYCDSKKDRLEYFKKSLIELGLMIWRDYPHIKKIAFPHRIGCGIAGGNWIDYKRVIEMFAKFMKTSYRKDVNFFIIGPN